MADAGALLGNWWRLFLAANHSAAPAGINKHMKTYTIPATASRAERDRIIARIIRHIACVQRTVTRIQADEAKGDKVVE